MSNYKEERPQDLGEESEHEVVVYDLRHISLSITLLICKVKKTSSTLPSSQNVIECI